MNYPQDILTAAESALDALLCNCPESCGGSAGVREVSIMDIAKALAAEREACAKIAEAEDYNDPNDEGSGVARNIAARIRARGA